jgi:hypothetical protein
VNLSGWNTNILQMNPNCLSTLIGGQAMIPISFSAITIIKVLEILLSMLDFELTHFPQKLNFD